MFAGGAVSWLSRSQKTISLSSCESEYISLADCVKDVLFLKQVFGFMSPKNKDKKVVVYEDNEGAIQLANNPLSSSRSKHIHVRYHFIRNEIREGNVSVSHIKSKDQCADVMTKPLPQDVFNGHCRFILGL